METIAQRVLIHKFSQNKDVENRGKISNMLEAIYKVDIPKP